MPLARPHRRERAADDARALEREDFLQLQNTASTMKNIARNASAQPAADHAMRVQMAARSRDARQAAATLEKLQAVLTGGNPAAAPNADLRTVVLGDAPMRFLIVDDDPGCRDLFSLTFGRYAVCDAVADGAAALDAFRAALDEGRPYDLIFLDIMMPGTDGHQTLDSIRRLEAECGRAGRTPSRWSWSRPWPKASIAFARSPKGCESYVAKPVEIATSPGGRAELVGPLSPLPAQGRRQQRPANPRRRRLSACGCQAFPHRRRRRSLRDVARRDAFALTGSAISPTTGTRRSMR